MKIKSEFALLDSLEKVNSPLKKHFANGGEKIPVTIKGYITGAWSGHDGTSREYEVDVTSVVCEEANQ